MENIVAFHGADHKAGVTMVAQSVAQIIAESNPDIRVLFAALNGRKSCEFIKKPVKTIDEYKIQMDSRVFINKDFSKDCRYSENLDILGGLVAEQEERYYYPDSVRFLLESVNEQFNLVIVDTGSEFDSGIAVGALEAANHKIMVLSQQESIISRYEKNLENYKNLKLDFDEIVVNKYRESDSYSMKYISKRIGMGKDQLYVLPFVNLWAQAEQEEKTFFELKNQEYIAGLEKLSANILESLDLPVKIKKKKGKLWKSFM